MRGIPHPQSLTTRHGENNVDRGLYVHRLAIEVVRLIPPLLDGIQCGTREHGVAADYVQVLDGAIFADQGLEHHRTLNTSLAGQRRINRCRFTDQQSLRDAGGYAHPLRGSGLGDRYGGGAKHTAQNAAHATPGHAARYAAHYASDSRGRWRLVLFNHLNLFRNGGRCPQLAVVQLALDLLHDMNFSGRWWWWWRRWRRRNQEGHQLLPGQRLGEN